MDLVVMVVGELLLIGGVALDLRALRRRSPTRGEIEPFRIWAMRVYFFSVLALPFYFWRTRGRFRWAFVGVALGAAYLWAMSVGLGQLAGCSSGPEGPGPQEGRPPIQGRDGQRGEAADAPDDAGMRAALVALRSARFPEVEAAQERLVREGGSAAVQGLVAMLGDDTRVQLSETGELVYPGGHRFHGAGRVVPYDIDRIGARAGWVLESLTLRDFGFRRAPYPGATVQPEDPGAALRARTWWAGRGGRFARLDAVVAAIEDAEGVQRDALRDALLSVPLEPPLARGLRPRIVPALRAALAQATGDRRTTLCLVARGLYLRELAREDPRVGPVLDRRLAGNADLLAAVSTALAPELVLTSDVPGASEVLAPPYAMSAAEGLEELVRRMAYAQGEARVGFEIADGRIAIYTGDLGREATAWARVLAP